MLPFKENIELLPKSETDDESNHQGTNSNNESIQDLDSISKDDDTNIISTFGLFDGEIFYNYNIPTNNKNRKNKNNDDYKNLEIKELRDEIDRINKIKDNYEDLIKIKDNKINELNNEHIREINEIKTYDQRIIIDKENRINELNNELTVLIKEHAVKIEHEKELMDKDNKIKNLEKDNEENNKTKIDMNMIKSKCDVYYNLFIRLYDKLTITKKRLDLYQTYLKRINSIIQLSVITLSIASSFIQALDSTNYEFFFSADTIVNSTEYTNYETNMDESTYSSTVGIVTLSISTYSALVIAAERHFSFQQRETNVEKLKESYAEPINRIRTNLELIRPWRYKSYYMKTNSETNNVKNNKADNTGNNKLVIDDDRKKKWIAMVDKLDSEYTHIVDVKKELDTSLDKLISIKTIKSYQHHVPRKKRDVKEENINDMEKHSNNNNFMYNWWINCFLNCWKCRCKQVNHSYDEEDLNHIEDREEIEKINVTHIKELNKEEV